MYHFLVPIYVKLRLGIRTLILMIYSAACTPIVFVMWGEGNRGKDMIVITGNSYLLNNQIY